MLKRILNIFKDPLILPAYLEKFIKLSLYFILVRSRVPSVMLDEVYNGHQINKCKLAYYFITMNFIEGWLTKDAARLFIFLDYLQKKELNLSC